MKRTQVRIAVLASILAALGVPQGSRAQNAPQTSARMSASIGVARSRMTGEDAARYGLDQPITGLYVGLAGDIPIRGSQVFRFGPGGRYLGRGYKLEVDQSTTTLKYVEFIAPLIVEVPLFAGLSLNVTGGPGVALSMGCTIKTTTDNVQRSLDCQNEDLLFKGYDFTAVGSGGFSFVIPNGTRVLLSAGIDQGLTSIDSTGEGIDFKNQSILIGAQATFPLGPRRR